MSLDYKGFSSRKADILKYIQIFDGFNHTTVAWVLLAEDHSELDSIVRRLKKDGRYFNEKDVE